MFALVQVTKVFGDPNHELALVRLPKEENTSVVGTYIVDKNQPSCRVEIDVDKNISPSSDKLFVGKTTNSKSKTFFFVYHHFLFKIEDAIAIHVVDFQSCKVEKNAYMLLILNKDNIGFYSFSTEYTNYYKYLGSIDNSYIFPYFSDQINHNTFSLKLTFHEDFYYIDYNCDTTSILKEDKKLMIVRFNLYQLQCYTILDNSKAIISANKNLYGLSKYYITANHGIFDVFHFKFFDLANMFKAIGTNYMDFSYEIFTTPNGQEFVFISEKPIDFSKFENPRFFKEYLYGDTVKGMLYSISKNEFVLPLANDKNRNSPWTNFFIYDNGIPHVFEMNSSQEETEYGIIFMDNKRNKFSKLVTTTLSAFISHTYVKDMKDPESFELVKKRIIFTRLKKNNRPLSINHNEEITTNDSMIVMDDNLTILYINNSTILEAVFAHTYSTFFSSERFRLAFMNTQEQSWNYDMNMVTYATAKNKIFHLLQKDSLIIKSYHGELGEYILVPLGDEFKVDYSLSFYYYSSFHIYTDFDLDNTQKNKNCKAIPYLKVRCSRNDFESQVYIVNLNNFQIFEYEDFIAYVAKNFSIQI